MWPLGARRRRAHRLDLFVPHLAARHRAGWSQTMHTALLRPPCRPSPRPPTQPVRRRPCASAPASHQLPLLRRPSLARTGCQSPRDRFLPALTPSKTSSTASATMTFACCPRPTRPQRVTGPVAFPPSRTSQANLRRMSVLRRPQTKPTRAQGRASPTTRAWVCSPTLNRTRAQTEGRQTRSTRARTSSLRATTCGSSSTTPPSGSTSPTRSPARHCRSPRPSQTRARRSRVARQTRRRQRGRRSRA